MGPLVLISLSQHFLLFLHTWLVRDVYVLFSWRGLCTYLPYLVNLWGGSHLITVEFVCMVFFRVFISMSSCCVHRGAIDCGLMASGAVDRVVDVLVRYI